MGCHEGLSPTWHVAFPALGGTDSTKLQINSVNSAGTQVLVSVFGRSILLRRAKPAALARGTVKLLRVCDKIAVAFTTKTRRNKDSQRKSLCGSVSLTAVRQVGAFVVRGSTNTSRTQLLTSKAV